MKIRMNITPKLTLIFVLFAAVLVAVVSLLAYTNGRAALESATVVELFSVAVEKQSALNAWVAGAETHTIALSSSPYLQEKAANFLTARASGDAAEIEKAHDSLVAELQAWAGNGLDYLGWMVLDPGSGQVIAATDPGEEGKFRENQPYFINGKSGSYVQNLYYSPSTQSTLMTISAPIQSQEGALLGVLAGNLDLANVYAIIARRTGLRQSDDAFLVNTASLFVTQPRFLSDPVILLRGVHTEAVEQCLRRNSGATKAPDYRGKPAIIVYRWLPERQLCLIVKMDQAEALAPVRVLRNNIFLISSLALLAAAALAWWLARTITHPVQQLAEAAREIGAGKLAPRLEIKTGDEIEQLTKALVEMAGNLRTAQETLVRQERLATLGQVAGSIGHELRNPLGIISNAVYFLKMSQPEANDSIREYLDIIENETRTSDKIISDLLDFTRVKSMERVSASVPDLVQRTLERYPAPPAVEVTVDLPADLPPLHADPQHVSQILGNLVLNACQAMPKGGKLFLSASQEGDMIKIVVRDTGMGIPTENMARLFEPLFSTKTKGIGLGLPVSRKLAEANGGRIEARSEPGKGSSFTIFLPVYKDPA